jgi:hypothetical protein
MTDCLGIVHISGCLYMPVVRFHRFLGHISLRDIRDIVAAITFFRPGWMIRRDALAAQLHRARQVVDLHTGIVIVKLARHIPARRVQHVAQAIAHCRAAAMPDMQRSSRVCRNEFHPHLATRSEMNVAVSHTSLQYAAHHLLFGCGGDEHIDEARPRDLHLFDDPGFRQRRDQRMRDIARRFAQRFGQLHRQIAGVVAMGCQFGTFDQNLGLGCPGGNLAQGLREQFGQMDFEIEYDRHEAAPLKRRGLYHLARRRIFTTEKNFIHEIEPAVGVMGHVRHSAAQFSYP